MRRRKCSGVACFRSKNKYPCGRYVSERFLRVLYATWIHLLGQVNHLFVVTRILKNIMYCAFILMVRLSLPFGNKCWTKYNTYVLQWWLFFVNRLVTLSFVSYIRSSITTKFLVLGSKVDKSGRPSTKSIFACVIDNVNYKGCYSSLSFRVASSSVWKNSKRATNVVLPQPVGPATTQINGWTNLVSIFCTTN